MSQDEHEHLISYRTALGWLIASLGIIIGVAFGAGSAHLRITYLQAEMASMQHQAEYQSRQASALDQKLAILSNDMAWQVEATKIIAQKLEVSIPMKR